MEHLGDNVRKFESRAQKLERKRFELREAANRHIMQNDERLADDARRDVLQRHASALLQRDLENEIIGVDPVMYDEDPLYCMVLIDEFDERIIDPFKGNI